MNKPRARLLATALAILACAPVAANAQPPGGEMAQRLLAAHNRARAALGLPPLAWSDSLAAEARQWSETLARRGAFTHSPDALRHDHGENLFMGTAGAYSAEQMVGDFVAERADFRPGRFPDVARDGEWENVGHYTQLIWRGTTEMGCAIATGGGWDYLTCRYAPAGNIDGETVP